jgi:DNA-binding NtrC family response regulator
MTTQILIVDDENDVEKMILSVFRNRIKTNELQFLFAKDGQMALDILEKEPSIGVIVTDINMPVMDGLTLLSRLLELDRPYKVIVVTAYDEMSNIRTAMSRGACDFITKPVDFVDFVETLKRTIEDYELMVQRQASRLNKNSQSTPFPDI